MPEAFRAFRGLNGRPEANVFDTDFLKKKAEFTKQLVIEAVKGGSDFTVDVKETARDICDFVDALYEEFNARDWMLQIPTPEELKQQLDERDSAAAS